MQPVLVNFRAAVETTVLLVDDDVRNLYFRAETMKMSGFTVHTAGSPIEALSILGESTLGKIDVAVVDYDMPGVNGCVLADYLKSRYPELKTVLYSSALEVPEADIASVDAFISKLDGIGALISKIAELRQIDSWNPIMFSVQDGTSMLAGSEFC